MKERFSKWKENDAPLLIVMGQSNAHGHGTRLTEKEYNLTCSHVYGLSRAQNQSYDCQDVVWNPFTMFGMNLGETQDGTCCLGNAFACRWQEEVEHGRKIPALYVVQISIGSQGIDQAEKDELNMWWTERPKVIKPGNLNEVDISLYPLATHILELVIRNLKAQGKNPVIIGMHWNQWETEVFSAGEVLEKAKANYMNLFEGFYEVLGERCQTYLYRPISTVHKNEMARKRIVTIFQELEKEYDNIRIIDPSQSPCFRSFREDKGIFQQDNIHYTAEVQKWFATFQFEEVFGRKYLVLGDNIMAEGQYIDYLNEYFAKYRPEEKVCFTNGGICSEDVVKGLTEMQHLESGSNVFDRIEKVLKEQDPVHILICYGMNGGVYHPFSQVYFPLYREGIMRLISMLEEKGKKVVLVTPLPFDAASGGSDLHPYEKYDEVLKIYSDWLWKEYGKKGYQVIDLHTKMNKTILKMREKNPNYKSGDGIHPNKDGHTVIAQAVLDNLFKTTITGKIQEDKDATERWEGFETEYFRWKGYEVTVVKPTQSIQQRYWIYRTEFFGAFPSVDIAVLEKGYYVANIKICNRYGDAVAVNLMEEFRQMLVGRYTLYPRPILFGFSRGGLYALHYTLAYGENIFKLYLDAPVIDLYSWPAQYENGQSAEWQECKRCWNLPDSKHVYYELIKQALNRMTELAIPLVLVYGDADEVVPYEVNGALIEQQYKASDVPCLIIAKKDCGHHPHSLEEPNKIVDFLMKEADSI